MSDLFRFIMLRPPEKIESAQVIPVHAESDLLQKLREVRQDDNPREGMRQVAEAFMHDEAFVAQAADASLSHAFDGFQSRLEERLPADEGIGLDEWRQLVITSFAMTAPQLLLDPVWQKDKARLHDSLIAVKAGSWQPVGGFEHLSRYIRLIALIELVAAADTILELGGAAREMLQRAIALPPDLFPLPPAPQAAPNGSTHSSGASDEEALLQKHDQLQKAYRLLTRLEPDDITINASSLTQAIGEQPRVNMTETELLLRDRAGQFIYEEIERMGDVEMDIQSKLTRWRQVHDFVSDERLAAPDGSPPSVEQSVELTVTRLNLTPSALARISPEIHAALAELDIQLDSANLPVAVERIKEELAALTPQVAAVRQRRVTGQLSTRDVVAIGDQFFQRPILPDAPARPLQAAAGEAPVLPATHGSVKPVGVGDLLVVRQQLKGYRAGEVAHIENILRGEEQTRKVRRLETVEESTLTEQETTRVEERDLQSTERFEMQRESQNVQAAQGRLSGNSLQSPGYGPIVQFESNAETQLTGSQMLSKRTATNYSKDVTSRAASRVTERVRTQIVRRTVRQFEEETGHAFENKTGNGHIVGIYQWVDKVYQAQIYNYGKRLFYDLVVPEPAAFLLHAFARNQAEGQGLVKPEPFTVPRPDGTQRTLQPDDITDTNYAYYVARYQAPGVQAPPEAYITLSKVMVGAKEPQPQMMELVVPAGYEPATRSFWLVQFWDPSSRGWLSDTFRESLDINISNGRYWRVQMGCRRNDSLYRQWQLDTYEALFEAYERQMADYEERLANLRAGLRVGALGQSAEQKRVLERTELKKACITLFTEQQFDLFNGIDSPADKPVLYPQLNLTNAAAQGRYIRFFEQAFEWEQLMYHFYPYFWGRKEQWWHKATLEDRDPLFAEFLKAGAARVLVPVRPGFEKAIVHYMETGELWDGNDLPPINSPLYVPLLEELRSQMPSQEVPYGEPWEVRLPTTLVLARQSDTLPQWKQDESGHWVEDN